MTVTTLSGAPATPASRPRPRASHGLALAAFVVGCNAAGGLGALATSAARYRALTLPAWAPPGWLFGPVWLALYTMMGVAAWLVWRRPAGAGRTRALTWFGAQLALNAAWTPVFFGLEATGAALAVIAALLVAIVATIAVFARQRRAAAALLVPYLAWVGFATALNGAIWYLN